MNAHMQLGFDPVRLVRRAYERGLVWTSKRIDPVAARREKGRLTMRAWREENPERVKAITQRQNAKLIAAGRTTHGEPRQRPYKARKTRMGDPDTNAPISARRAQPAFLAVIG